MHTVTICGSDTSYFRKGKCGIFELKGQPLILGHECSGLIEAVGDQVTNVKAGDRVAIEPGIPCRYCSHCRSGRYNLCPDVKFLATPPIDGALANYIEHPADFVYKMPDHMSYEEGALLEPLSVAVHACDRGGIKAGSHVLITGAGPVGLVCLLVARASGATKIYISDVLEHRLALAKKLGANGVLKASDPIPDLVTKLNAESGGITHSIECSGHETALTLCIKATSPGGKLLSIGRGHKDYQSIPLFEAADKEIDILGSFRYHGTYAKALELVASGQVNVKDLVSHRFTLEKVQEAFETAEVGKDGAIKVAINVS
jgi:L-iditol 2-dehydrogenase